LVVTEKGSDKINRLIVKTRCDVPFCRSKSF